MGIDLLSFKLIYAAAEIDCSPFIKGKSSTALSSTPIHTFPNHFREFSSQLNSSAELIVPINRYFNPNYSILEFQSETHFSQCSINSFICDSVKNLADHVSANSKVLVRQGLVPTSQTKNPVCGKS